LTFAELAAQNQHLEAENGELREALLARDERLDALERKLAWFERQVFGAKSEKRTWVDPAVQPSLLASLGVAIPEPPEVEDTPPAKPKRRKKSRQDTVTDEGLRFGPGVPVEVIEILPEELKGPNADDYEVIGFKSTFRLAQLSGSYVAIETRRPVIKHKVTGEVKTTPAPPNVLDRSVADVSFLAGMLVDKFGFHLPYYRQHQRLLAAGFQLSRTTFTTLTARSAQLLAPIAQAQLEHIFESRVLAMDETHIKAGRVVGKHKMQPGYFWPLYGEEDEVSFTFANSRGQHVIQGLLGDHFEGILLTDGYKVYERHAKTHPGVVHAQCWAHTRRKFEEIKDKDPTASAEALALIGVIYEQEAWIRQRKLEGPDKRDARQVYCAPAVEAFWTWCDQQCHRLDLTPKHPLSAALKYAMARRDALEVFLREPEVQVDTNHLERALRPIPMGRRNWLFCWTEVGAEYVATIQSLLVTCRLHGVDPYTYFVDVLQRVGSHPASQVIDLTPRRWKELFASDPLRSDLDRAVPKTRA